jgi:hypothetical protein
MSIRIVQERLNQYQSRNSLEEENAIKEITQEIALSGLSRAGFFKVAAFQGGTCLRVFHGLNRFSEDLDFALNEPDPVFEWAPYLKSLRVELEAYGYHLEIQDRLPDGNPVKSVFLKDDSIGKILLFNHRGAGARRAIKIKLEIDANPPAGAVAERKYVEFPVTVPVLAHDLPSLFAWKSHALLCRPWEKGRDWFDFIWYAGRKTRVDFELLSNALDQLGPWKGQGVRVTKKWYFENLCEKIQATDWEKQKKDVSRFLKQADADLLDLWGREFFLDRARALEGHL